KAFVREETTAEAIDSLRRAPRAMVFLYRPSSDWSQRARERFLSAVAWLAADVSVPGLHFFVLDTDCKAYQDWLGSAAAGDFWRWLPEFNGTLPSRERGQRVAAESTSGALLSADGTVAQTRKVWAPPLHRAVQLPAPLQRPLESRR